MMKNLLPSVRQSAGMVIRAAVLHLAVTCAFVPHASAQQNASLQGIVSDGSSGQVLTGAFVQLEAGGTVVRSVITDRNGLFLMGAIAPGTYTLRVRYLGYADGMETVTLGAGIDLTMNIGLRVAPIAVAGVTLDIDLPEVGGVIRELGRQTVTAQEIRRIPTPAASGDLATYLQTLPGVVTGGDRGGQIFIRGGTHTENMSLMDGMFIYQPFHILTGFSVFPEDLVASADFYAGGFGARYNGRASAVLDVRMRDGDRSGYHGGGSIGPVMAEMTAEGPLGNRAISWIVSARRSLIDETADSFLGEPAPLTFENQFLKVTSFTDDPHTRCSLTAIRSSDYGRMDPEDEVSRVGWKNLGIGTRCVALFSDSNLRLIDVGVSYSRVGNDAIARNMAELRSKVRRFQVDANFTNLVGSARVDWGFYGRTKLIEHDLIELFGGKRTEEVTWEGGAYVEPTLVDSENLTLVTGLVTTILPIAHFEPRVRVAWRPWGREQGGELTGAWGIYRQPLVGISDIRDASSVFVAWKEYNEDADPVTSMHTQVGWQQRRGRVNGSIEFYHRRMTNISVPQWAVTVLYNTELALANGTSYGADARLEYRGNRFQGFVGYGYSWTKYKSAQRFFTLWYGEPLQSYHPPHDRRHQVNVVGSVDVADFVLAARWQLGSGLPFTQPLGFEEYFNYQHLLPYLDYEYGKSQMLLDRPYTGRLPPIHRLDLSIQREFDFSFGKLEARGGAMNLYDRRNLFYFDLYTLKRVDQLPLFPYLAVKFTAG